MEEYDRGIIFFDISLIGPEWPPLRDNRTLEGLKQISDKFEILLRNKNLSWNHHKEVSSIKKLKGGFISFYVSLKLVQ